TLWESFFEKLFAMKADGIINNDEYQRKKAAILKEEAEIKCAISSDRTVYWEKIIDETLNFAGTVKEIFNSDDKVARRLVLQIIGSNLELKGRKLIVKPKGAFLFLKQGEDRVLNTLTALELRQNTDTEPIYPTSVDEFLLSEAAGTRTQDP
ncbi:MAG: hypothetical protein M1609_04330, partial [Firmicutes bacterium]|nr:hypothetical protein [Bacillota bacterium]